jgi:hypothetical protein
MSKLLDAFQRRHQEKLDQLERGEDAEALLDGVHILIDDLRQAGAVVADPVERGQLRALLRFWGSVACDRAGVYPDAALQPLDPANVRPSGEPARRALPPLNWMLIGAAAALVIAASLVAIVSLSRPRDGGEPPPTPTPAPSASYATVEVMTGEGMVADVFCPGTGQVLAQVALAGAQPETVWRWELQREGERVAAQPPAPWGQAGEQRSFPVLGGEGQDIGPGQYVLLVYAGERTVGARAFQVLVAAPRVSGLRVTDDPDLAGEGPGDGRFEASTQAVYVSYEYAGLCPGIELSLALYRQGELVQESVEAWRGVSQAQAQVTFRAAEGGSLSPGSYEAVVAVGGAERARASFAIGETTEKVEPTLVPPAFGAITLALGVQPEGTPFLTEPDNRFDWNTKAVYAVFDYSGMRDGLAWTAVWMLDGEEVARQEATWDVSVSGAEGTAWAAYYDESRWVLASGSYTVTLYVDGVKQQSASFEIVAYEPEGGPAIERG